MVVPTSVGHSLNPQLRGTGQNGAGTAMFRPRRGSSAVSRPVGTVRLPTCPARGVLSRKAETIEIAHLSGSQTAASLSLERVIAASAPTNDPEQPRKAQHVQRENRICEE